MIRSILALFLGTAMLICCLGAQAKSIVMAETSINESTGLTLSLVLGAIAFVAWGAWQLATYVMKQEVRIREIERRLKEGTDDDQ